MENPSPLPGYRGFQPNSVEYVNGQLQLPRIEHFSLQSPLA
jgi:hypothetical protein